MLRASDLAAWLPAGSAVWIATDSRAAWTNEAYLTAGLWDALNVFCWSMSDPNQHAPYPKPIPRPGEENRHRDGDVDSMTPEQMDEYLRRPRTESL